MYGLILLRSFVLVLFYACWSCAAFAQPGKTNLPATANMTLNSVMQGHLAALGDVNKVESRRVKLRIIGMAPFEIPTTTEAKRPNLLRLEVQVQGQVQISSYDGKDAWKIDPFQPSGKRAVDPSAEELPAVLEESYSTGFMTVQKQLAEHKARRLKLLKWAFLLGQIVWFIPFILVLFKGLFGVDLYLKTENFIGPSLIGGVLFIPLAIGISKLLSGRLKHSARFQAFTDTLAGKDIIQTRQFLSKIAQFEEMLDETSTSVPSSR